MTMTAEAMTVAADQACDLLKSLANRHRLLLLCLLIEGEHSVGVLAALLDLRCSTVSQHLALLRRDGLVAARRDGQTIRYSIASPAARVVIGALHQVYCAPPQSPQPGLVAAPRTSPMEAT